MRAILTWHSLDDSRSPISVAPAHFRRQLAWIEESGLRVVPVSELLTLPDHAHAVALTFDDGFANFAAEAAPLLQDRGWPATLFVVTDHVGGDNRWRADAGAGIPVLPLLDWDGLATLAATGVAVENHSRTHPHLDRLDPTSVAAEIDGAASVLRSRLGRTPSGIAYPYGDFDEATISTARTGHRWGVTTEFRPLHTGVDPLTLPRLDAWYFRTRRHFTAWGAAHFHAWVWARRTARAARAAVAGPIGRPSTISLRERTT